MLPPTVKITARQILRWHNRIHREPVVIAEFEMVETPSDPTRFDLLRRLFSEAFPDAGPLPPEAEAPTVLVWMTRAIQQAYDVAPPVVGLLRSARPGRRVLYAAWRDEMFAQVPCDGALGLLSAVLGPDAYDLRRMRIHMRQLLRACGLRSLNMLPRNMAAEAEARGLPWVRLLSSAKHIAVGHGKARRIIRNSMGPGQSAIGTELARDKAAHLRLLAGAGIPVGAAEVVRTVEDALAVAKRIGYPVAFKPVAGSFGKGVRPRITTPEALAAAAEAEFAADEAAVIQRFFEGYDHRLLIIDGKLVAASRRIVPQVTGDGVSTVQALIDTLNEDPRRGPPTRNLLEKVEVDEITLELLGREGLSLADVPEAGREIPLKEAANIQSGSSAIDVSDRVHPDTAALAARAARMLSLRLAGVDIITPDIEKSWREVGAGVCEVNGTPMMRPHWATGGGPEVTPILMDHALEGAGDSRIPVALAIGGSSTGDAIRLAADLLAPHQQGVGTATDRGIRLDADLIDDAPAVSAEGGQRLLSDPAVETALLQTTHKAFLANGLALDRWAVGVLTELTGTPSGTPPEVIALRGATDAVVIALDDPGLRALLPELLKTDPPRRVFGLLSDSERDSETVGAVHRAGGGVLLTSADGRIRLTRPEGTLDFGPVTAGIDPKVLATTLGIVLALGMAPESVQEALTAPPR